MYFQTIGIKIVKHVLAARRDYIGLRAICIPGILLGRGRCHERPPDAIGIRLRVRNTQDARGERRVTNDGACRSQSGRLRLIRLDAPIGSSAIVRRTASVVAASAGLSATDPN